MGRIANVNVNEASFRSNFNVNDKRRAKVQRVQRIAADLEKKFGGDAANCHNFFLKCAWRFSEDFIWSTFEAASHGKTSAIKYFIAVMKAQPEMCD